MTRWTESGAPTYLYYDGWNLIQEGPSFSNTARLYFHGGRVDEIVASYNAVTDMMAYHYYDASGHCTLLTDWQGNIMEQYYYDAFGKPYLYNASNGWNGELGSSGHGNRFLFTGREWLSDLKLYDHRHRLYQPELGRFLQPDPKHFAAGDYNLYRYCHNDPVNNSDPFGLLEANHEDKELAKPVPVKDTYRPVTGSHIPIHIRVFHSGNWNDRTVANHATDNLERDTGKAGLTRASGSSNVSGANVDITMHVNWYYDTNYGGTDVVTRELQHVQDARSFSRGYWDGRSQPASMTFVSSQISSEALTSNKSSSMIKVEGFMT